MSPSLNQTAPTNDHHQLDFLSTAPSTTKPTQPPLPDVPVVGSSRITASAPHRSEVKAAPDQLNPATIASADESKSIAGCAAFLMSDTHYEADGRMAQDNIGASVSTASTIFAGALALGDGQADPRFLRAVAQACYQHADQLEFGAKTGCLSPEQVAITLALGRPVKNMSEDDRTRLAPYLEGGSVRAASLLTQGIVGSGKVLGNKLFADRMANLGFSPEEMESAAQHFAGRRIMYAFDDSLSARAAAASLAQGLKASETIWAQVPVASDMPLGTSPVGVQVGSTIPGTIVATRIPAADPARFPFDPSAYAMLTPGVRNGSLVHTFTADRWKAMRDDLGKVLGDHTEAPLWALALVKTHSPEVPPAEHTVTGHGMLITRRIDRGEIAIATQPSWENPLVEELINHIKGLNGRRFERGYNGLSFWVAPEAEASRLMKRLEGSTNPQSAGALTLLSDPKLGISVAAQTDAPGALVASDVNGTAIVKSGSVRLEKHGSMISMLTPPPWAEGWSDVKDLVKLEGRAKYNGVRKCWTIHEDRAESLARALDEQCTTRGVTEMHAKGDSTPLALVKALQHPSILGNPEKRVDPIHDATLAAIRDVVETNRPSARIDKLLEGKFPAGLALKDHQKVFVDIMERTNHRLLLGDDMGMGKTVSVAAYLAAFPDRRPCLVVAPANVRGNWANEIRKWGAKEGITVGEVERRDGSIPKTDVAVMTYAVLKDHVEGLAQRGYRTLVLDECHYVKEPSSKRSKASVAIWEGMQKAYPDSGIIGLSGTPVPNQAKELGSVMAMINPKMYPDMKHYLRDFCIEGYKSNGYGMSTIWGLKNAPQLFSLLRQGRDSLAADKDRPACMPLMLRRTKADFADLPPLETKTLGLTVSAQEQQALATTNAEMIRNLQVANTHSEVLAVLNAQRQITGIMKAGYIGDHAAAIAAQGESSVIFLHHEEAVNVCRDRLRQHGIDPLVMTGKTPADQRSGIAAAFQRGDSPVIICTQAAREGITLTKAHRLIQGEVQWNPAAMNQARDRIHRIGQESPCLVEFIVLPNSIDEHLTKIVRAKAANIDAMIDGVDPDDEAPSNVVSAVYEAIVGRPFGGK